MPYPAAKKLATDESIYIIPIDVVSRMNQGQRTTFERLARAAYFNSVLSIIATRQRIKPFTLGIKMKLAKHYKRLIVLCVIVALASLNGIFSGIVGLVHGRYVLFSILSVALGVLGGWGVFVYFKDKRFIPWLFYLWLAPQLVILTTSTYNYIERTVEMELNYGVFLLPQVSSYLGWKLREDLIFQLNFHIIAIALLVFLLVTARSIKSKFEPT